MTIKKQTSPRRILELLALFVAGSWLLISALQAGTRLAVPYAFDELIDTYAKEHDLDKSLVAALIYQESRFQPDARSNKGATGLMQIMPDTGEWIAGRTGMAYSRAKLIDPEYNLRMGTYYLAYLMKKYDGDETLALAAYNAGPGSVDGWLRNDSYSKNGKLTDIPFKETREYVPKVLKMKDVYEKLYHDKQKETT